MQSTTNARGPLHRAQVRRRQSPLYLAIARLGAFNAAADAMKGVLS